MIFKRDKWKVRAAPSLRELNKVMTRKIFFVWGGAFFLFLLCFTGLHGLTAIARQIANFFPFVSDQFQKATPIGDFAATYFGLAVPLVLGSTCYLLTGQDIVTRARAGIENSGGVLKYFLVVCLLGIPFCVLMLGLIYFAPIDVPQNPRLFGQIVVHTMINSYAGLLIFGSIAIVAAALLLSILVSYFLIPFLFLYNLKKDI
jgi:hypothetical protein